MPRFSRPRFDPNRYVYKEAAHLILAALQRQGRSFKAACQAAGVAQSAVQYALNGTNVPYRDHWQALADALGEPALVWALPTRLRHVVMTCTACGEVEVREFNRVFPGGKRVRHPEATLNRHDGTGAWLCQTCGNKQRINENMIQPYKQRQKEVGKGRARDEWNDKRSEWRDDPSRPPSATILEPNIKKAQDANRGTPFTEEHRWKSSLIALARHHQGEARESWVFDYCGTGREGEGCGELMWWKAAVGPPVFGMHRSHRDAFLQHAGPHALPPQRPPGNRYSRAALLINYQLVIGFAAIGRTVPELAHLFGLSEPTVRRRIRDFLRDLPTDDRGGKDLVDRASALRFGASAPGQRWHRHRAEKVARQNT